MGEKLLTRFLTFFVTFFLEHLKIKNISTLRKKRQI